MPGAIAIARKHASYAWFFQRRWGWNPWFLPVEATYQTTETKKITISFVENGIA
jgi:carbohydrate-binding DOMON domain-containing protein